MIVGTRTLKFVDLTANGHLVKVHSKDDVGRILKFHNDDRYKCGILLLTDQSTDHSLDYDYNLSEQVSLYKFPLTSIQTTSKVTLKCLKKGTFYELLNSETNAGLIARDSNFSVLRANRAVFE